MALVRVVEVALDEIIDMIAVGNGFMATIRAVDVPLGMSGALMSRRAVLRIGLGHRYGMLVKMVIVRAMQVAVVQITDMVVMDDSGMTAFGSMRMSMIFVPWQVTIGHCHSLASKSGCPHRGAGGHGCVRVRRLAMVANCFSRL
jgi:hypothetical protein